MDAHIGLRVANLEASIALYTSALAPLGYFLRTSDGTPAGFGPDHVAIAKTPWRRAERRWRRQRRRWTPSQLRPNLSYGVSERSRRQQYRSRVHLMQISE